MPPVWQFQLVLSASCKIRMIQFVRDKRQLNLLLADGAHQFSSPVITITRDFLSRLFRGGGDEFSGLTRDIPLMTKVLGTSTRDQDEEEPVA